MKKKKITHTKSIGFTEVATKYLVSMTIHCNERNTHTHERIEEIYVWTLTFGGAFCGGQPTNISVEIFCEPELVCVPIGDFPVLGAIWYPKQYEISLQRKKKRKIYENYL